MFLFSNPVHIRVSMTLTLTCDLMDLIFLQNFVNDNSLFMLYEHETSDERDATNFAKSINHFYFSLICSELTKFPKYLISYIFVADKVNRIIHWLYILLWTLGVGKLSLVNLTKFSQKDLNCIHLPIFTQS